MYTTEIIYLDYATNFISCANVREEHQKFKRNIFLKIDLNGIYEENSDYINVDYSNRDYEYSNDDLDNALFSPSSYSYAISYLINGGNKNYKNPVNYEYMLERTEWHNSHSLRNLEIIKRLINYFSDSYTKVELENLYDSIERNKNMIQIYKLDK